MAISRRIVISSLRPLPGGLQTTGPGASKHNKKLCTCQYTGRGPKNSTCQSFGRSLPKRCFLISLSCPRPPKALQAGETEAHTNTCTRRPQNYTLAGLRAGAFQNGAFSPHRSFPALRGLSWPGRREHTQTHARTGAKVTQLPVYGPGPSKSAPSRFPALSP